MEMRGGNRALTLAAEESAYRVGVYVFGWVVIRSFI
jgi:hypothetical protein